MKTLSFNTLKPLAFTALFVVFAASFNIAAAGCIACKESGDKCRSNSECKEAAECIQGGIFKICSKD